MPKPTQINGYDFFTTFDDTEDKFFVLDPVADPEGNWVLPLGWWNVREGDKPHDAMCFTSLQSVDKLTKLRDGINKLIEVANA